MAAERDIPLITTIDAMHASVRDARSRGASIGCVPTMGYLHDGHASLIRAAAERHGYVVVSIFVNPTQFGPTEDFARYPRDLDRDRAIVAEAGGTAIFLPTVDVMYPNGPSSTIHINGVTEMLEGAHRPGHFDGVATVVARLFEAMLPDEAFFGQKDLQQTLVIKRLVATSAIPAVRSVRVTVLPTQRESDGLAMSSRNVYLSTEDRADAPVLYRALSAAAECIRAGEHRRTILEDAMRTVLTGVPRLSVDYAVAVDASTLLPVDVFAGDDTEVALLIAARLGSTRLIDNMVVPLRA
jgi:pantoate--beta-alanine ligase